MVRTCLLLAFLVFSLARTGAAQEEANWDRICPARDNFFKENLPTDNHLSAEDILDQFTADQNLQLIILSETHFQPSMVRLADLIRHLDQKPQFNCLFIEATAASWQDDVIIAQTFGSDHPLFFIRKFHEDLGRLPMKTYFVDETEQLTNWMRNHRFLLTPEETRELSYQEYTVRNRHMSRRIADRLTDGSCEKGVLIIGPNHLSRKARGSDVFSLPDLLSARGVRFKSLQLLDSELMLGLDYTLNFSTPSPILCFKNCAQNPELPKTELAFIHKPVPKNHQSYTALIETQQLDPHCGSAVQGLWTDFDATVIFPPIYINSCQDERRSTHPLDGQLFGNL